MVLCVHEALGVKSGMKHPQFTANLYKMSCEGLFLLASKESLIKTFKNVRYVEDDAMTRSPVVQYSSKNTSHSRMYILK